MDSRDQTLWVFRHIGPPPSIPECIEVVELKEGSTIFGRGATADVYIDSQVLRNFISRRHAVVVGRRDQDGRLQFVLHNHGLNGTYVNDVRIGDVHHLQEGDKVTFGHKNGYKVKIGETAQQPESEFQFILECNPSSRLGPQPLQEHRQPAEMHNGSRAHAADLEHSESSNRPRHHNGKTVSSPDSDQGVSVATKWRKGPDQRNPHHGVAKVSTKTASETRLSRLSRTPDSCGWDTKASAGKGSPEERGELYAAKENQRTGSRSRLQDGEETNSPCRRLSDDGVPPLCWDHATTPESAGALSHDHSPPKSKPSSHSSSSPAHRASSQSKSPKERERISSSPRGNLSSCSSTHRDKARSPKRKSRSRKSSVENQDYASPSPVHSCSAERSVSPRPASPRSVSPSPKPKPGEGVGSTVHNGRLAKSGSHSCLCDQEPSASPTRSSVGSRSPREGDRSSVGSRSLREGNRRSSLGSRSSREGDRRLSAGSRSSKGGNRRSSSNYDEPPVLTPEYVKTPSLENRTPSPHDLSEKEEEEESGDERDTDSVFCGISPSPGHPTPRDLSPASDSGSSPRPDHSPSPHPPHNTDLSPCSRASEVSSTGTHSELAFSGGPRGQGRSDPPSAARTQGRPSTEKPTRHVTMKKYNNNHKQLLDSLTKSRHIEPDSTTTASKDKTDCDSDSDSESKTLKTSDKEYPQTRKSQEKEYLQHQSSGVPKRELDRDQVDSLPQPPGQKLGKAPMREDRKAFPRPARSVDRNVFEEFSSADGIRSGQAVRRKRRHSEERDVCGDHSPPLPPKAARLHHRLGEKENGLVPGRNSCAKQAGHDRKSKEKQLTDGHMLKDVKVSIQRVSSSHDKCPPTMTTTTTTMTPSESGSGPRKWTHTTVKTADRITERGERTRERGDRTSEQRDRTTERGERNSEREERTSDQGERTSLKGERTSERGGDRTSLKGERTSEREGERTSERGGDRTSLKGERTSERGGERTIERGGERTKSHTTTMATRNRSDRKDTAQQRKDSSDTSLFAMEMERLGNMRLKERTRPPREKNTHSKGEQPSPAASRNSSRRRGDRSAAGLNQDNSKTAAPEMSTERRSQRIVKARSETPDAYWSEEDKDTAKSVRKVATRRPRPNREDKDSATHKVNDSATHKVKVNMPRVSRSIRKRKRRKKKEEEEDEEEEEEDESLEEGVTWYEEDTCASAHCHRPADRRVQWVCCDDCDSWYHTVCVGIFLEDLKEDEDYHCGCA